MQSCISCVSSCRVSSSDLFCCWIALKGMTVFHRFECVYSCSPELQQQLRDFFHALDTSYCYFTIFAFDCGLHRWCECCCENRVSRLLRPLHALRRPAKAHFC